MQYVYSIGKSLIEWEQNHHTPSSTFILSTARDILVLAESCLVSDIMTKTAKSQNNSYSADSIISSLKNTNRDLQDILNNIESLQQNINMPLDITPQQKRDIAQKTAMRLAQLRDEAVIIQDYTLAYQIENLFDAAGILD